MATTPDESQQPNEQPLHEDTSIQDFQPTDEVLIAQEPVATELTNEAPIAQEPIPTPIVTKKNPLVSLLKRSAIWRWSLIVVGLLILVVGSTLIYSAASITYQGVQGTIDGFVNASAFSQTDSNFYVDLNDSQSVYFFNPKDFTPTLALSKDLRLNGSSTNTKVSFTYRPDQSVNIDKTFTLDLGTIGSLNVHVHGKGYEVMQLTVFDSNGQNPKLFTSAKYTSTQNKLGRGITALSAGLVVAALAFAVPIIRRRLGKDKKQAALNVTPALAMATPVTAEMQSEPEQPQLGP